MVHSDPTFRYVVELYQTMVIAWMTIGVGVWQCRLLSRFFVSTVQKKPRVPVPNTSLSCRRDCMTRTYLTPTQCANADTQRVGNELTFARTEYGRVLSV